MSDLVEQMRRAALMLPIRVQDGQDYAEAFGQDFHAMTVTPERFEALNGLSQWIDRITALEAENTRLREALAPFAYAAFEADGWPDEEAFTLVLRPDAEEYDDGDSPERESLITARQLRFARTALNKGGPNAA